MRTSAIPTRSTATTSAFERLLADLTKKNYVLRLYVTGSTPNSLRAIANVRNLCEKYLHGYYRLEIIDLYQQPELAQGEQIIASPTLVKQLPLPVRRVLGDMSRTERVLVTLGLRDASEDAAPTEDVPA